MVLSNDNIIHDDNPMIRQKSDPVALPLSEDDRQLLQAMYDYVRDSHDDELCQQRNLSPAVGLAAIQTGVPKKMIAVSIPDEEGGDLEWALVNPKIVSRSIQQIALKDGEGCLSVPDSHPGQVFRSARIKVRGYDLLTDQNVTIQANGYPAIVLQHEIDHLSGTLYYDHIGQDVPEDAMVIE